MGKNRNAMAVFNQSFLLIVIHLLLVFASFIWLKTTPTQIENNVTQRYQELEWSKLVHIFSQDNKYIHLQKIKPRWDIFGFELNLQGSYLEFNQWLLQLHQQYPFLKWSHIRLSQKKSLMIEMEGFGHV